MRRKTFGGDGGCVSAVIAKDSKTALAHDWLTSKGGAENVLEAIYALYPGPLHVLVQDEDYRGNSFWKDKKIHSSFLQKFPFAKKAYRHYLPFFPLAVEQFDLSEYDLILSSSHAVSKNVLTHTGQLHICYCHTPMRYAWDLYHEYMKGLKGIKKGIARGVLHYLRGWDYHATNRVDHFIANSHYIARRIKKVYNREASVVYPPVEVNSFFLASAKEEFYLTVSRMVPYKKIDLIVQAFSQMPDKKLVVIGDGPEMTTIKRCAGKNIELLGICSDQQVRAYMAKAKAFIFAAEEDFGIVPVEAQAAGTPVIAYGRGGVLETIQNGVTGVFFPKQSVESLKDAVTNFESQQNNFDPLTIQKHAQRFSRTRFDEEYRKLITTKLREFHESHRTSWW